MEFHSTPAGRHWLKGVLTLALFKSIHWFLRQSRGPLVMGLPSPGTGPLFAAALWEDELQSDFLFMNAEGGFCMIATETPGGMPGWLPCKWFLEG